MVVNFGHVVFAQVRQLVANLNKKNFKASSGELSQANFNFDFVCVRLEIPGADNLLLQLVDVYGHDVYVFLFRSLISHLDLKNTKASQDQIRLQLLGQELAVVATKSNYVSTICQAFEGAPLTDDFCSNLAKLLKLTFAHHITFGLALAQSMDPTVQQQGAILH
jgi:hypothetical protein